MKWSFRLFFRTMRALTKREEIYLMEYSYHVCRLNQSTFVIEQHLAQVCRQDRITIKAVTLYHLSTQEFTTTHTRRQILLDNSHVCYNEL